MIGRQGSPDQRLGPEPATLTHDGHDATCFGVRSPTENADLSDRRGHSARRSDSPATRQRARRERGRQACRINYIDTAPAYGNGYSEQLVGEVMRERRQDCVLASKVWYEHDRSGVIESVNGSLKRLQTDHIDILQIHGRMYSPAEVEHILHGGVLEALLELREEGKIRHIGITSDEPWTVIPFLEHEAIEVYQIAYNIIYQAASRHFLIEAAKVNTAVVTMRTMTSGVFQREASFIAPEWQSARDLYEVALKFVLSDSRVHAGIIGMRWPEEVEHNLDVARRVGPARRLRDHAPSDLRGLQGGRRADGVVVRAADSPGRARLSFASNHGGARGSGRAARQSAPLQARTWSAA